MYIAYIDSSGRPIKEDTQEKCFVLSCMIAHEAQWQYIDNKVKEIKLKHFPRLADVELHAKDMLNREDPFKRLRWEEIYAIFDDIFRFLNDIETNLCIISVVIQKEKMFSGKDIEKWAYRLLVERIDKFLEKNSVKSIAAGMSVQYGIMIIDSCGYQPDSKLRRKITELLKGGTYYSRLKYLIEDPLFTDSKWRNLSQLVDCIAYAVRRHYEGASKTSLHAKKWKKYFEMIYHKHDNDGNGRIEGCGIKVFP